MSPTPRIVRREPSSRARFSLSSLRPGELLAMLRSYFGLSGASRLGPIDSPEALAHFIETRASYMAQTSLYGYLRTRMGMRYPELFDDDVFVVGINLAKWQIWLDCLGDLAVYSGSRMAQEQPREADRVAALMVEIVDGILKHTALPADAGPEFRAHARQVRERLARAHWLAIGDREAAFTESPKSVLKWAPIAEELKQLDEEIVLNSVRFHWQEIRRNFVRHIDTAGVLGTVEKDRRSESVSRA